LGSRHHSLQMTEVADVRDTWQAFELQNRVKLEIRTELVSRSGIPDLVLTAIAHEEGLEIGEAKVLASVSVRCSATNLRHWKDAHTHVLYALDFKLALNELEGVAVKKA
jgi:hypothetical protein